MLTAAQIYHTDAVVENPGNVTVMPTIRIRLADDAETDDDGFVPDITLTVYMTESIRGNAVVLTQLKPGDDIVLDWNMGDAYYWETRTSANNHVIGNPQRLSPGGNRVRTDSAAVEQVTITPHWRWA